MKKIYWFIIAVIVVTLLILLFSFINRDRMMDKLMEMSMDRLAAQSEYLEDLEGIRVFTLGTAAPLPSDRNQSSTAVFVGGKFFIFDLGDGAIKQAEMLNLPISKLDAVFISHWHTDHYIELPHVINRTWQMGRDRKLEVYGPVGLDSILHATQSFLRQENKNRIAHHGPEIMNNTISGATSNEINTDSNESQELLNSNGITITTFKVCHEPIDPSFGFRIDYKGKSVVISGDTRENCPNILKYAKGVDLLFHEVMLKDLFVKSSEINNTAGNGRNAKILIDIIDYHTSPTDVGAIAQEAGVKKLVLHHFAPIPSNIILRRRYKQAIRKNYLGPLSLAKDGSEYYIK